jgi:hypothetical protein
LRPSVANRALSVVGLGIVSLALAGCPSLSTLQTPRTVPQGQARFGFGLEGVGIKTASRTSNGTNVPATSVTLPQFEFSTRYGLSDNLDIGGKLYLFGAELGLKYQPLRGDLDLAIAPAASYLSLSDSSSDGSGNSSSSSISVTYLHLPLLFGLNLNDNFTLSFGPKLLYAIVSGTASSNSDTASATTRGLWVGGYVSIPIKVGQAFWIAPELNVYRPLNEDAFIYQGGLALLFGGSEPPRMPPTTAYPPPAYPPPAYPPPAYPPPSTPPPPTP